MGILVRPKTLLSVCCVLFFMRTASAVVSEYQLDSQPLLPCELAREKASRSGADYIPQCSDDGVFRNIQCTRNGLSCWCVNADGDEVLGSRRTGSPPLCLSFCQLEKQQILVSGYINRTSTSYIPQCKDSGEFEPVQCNQNLGQCWCVDAEGMEIYGTRQIGKPKQCPQNCEIRDRRILHGVGEKVPPHCSDDGEFLSVQCKLVNTTDKMIMDIVTSFSRFPDAFKSFTSLRESFPEVSGYCYCADRLGRELANTGLELLLDEVYDTVFAGQSPPHSFTETTIYRILQRRFLGVQLITSGKFRCPTTCEVQRYTASQTGDIYIPSCTENGDFEAVQCQTGGQCWCVDSKGRGIYGSRVQGKLPNCNKYQDCPNRRRQALSSLFYGPTGYFGQRSLFDTQEEEFGLRLGPKHCPSYVVDAFINSGLLNPIDERFKGVKTKIENFITDMVTGLFPSRDLIQLALRFTQNPKRFQQNLFGGKYLRNVGSFNFSGAVGIRSKFNFSGFFQQIGLTGMYSGGNFKELAKLFSSEEDSYLTKGSLNVSKPIFDLNQPIRASFGQIVNLQENQNLVALFASILELDEFSKFLREVASVPAKISQDVSETVKIILQSRECPERVADVFVPTCARDGRYDEIQCSGSECWCVDDSGKEVRGSRTQGKKPRCPTKCEKDRELQKFIRKSLPAGSELFVPSCDRDGNFLTVQCAGKNCFCVDFDGQMIPGTQKSSGENIQCPSSCQLTAGKAFLESSRELVSGSRTISELSEVFIPQCSKDGNWKPVQCSGATEQAFELYRAWTTQNENISFSETLRIVLTYKNTSSFSDFVLALYNKGYQNVFPLFSKYSLFSEIPGDVLGGNVTVQTDNILLNPYVFWRLLNGDLFYYPGSYSDFSVPLSHFDLRTCWCVDPNGQKIQGTEVEPNKVPKCPGTCERAKLKTVQFIEEAEDLIEASNSSHFPFGQSFLLANGIRLSEMDLLHADGSFKSTIPFSESFMDRDNYHLQLAAHSTLHFYWRRRFASLGETTQLAYVPYLPQCDELGEWDPVQFYESTGHYWCVDEYGNYIPDSLVARTSRPPQCQTSCQRSQLNALIASWIPQSFQSNSSSVPESLIPDCTETGQYTTSEMDSECIFSANKDAAAQGMNGSNNCPVCPFPFSSQNIKHGTVFCEEVTEGGVKFQKCQLKCRKGYYNVIPSEPLLCDLNSHVWVSQPPHPQSCQRVSSFQTVQTQASFELLLPSTKTCMADYSGLLQAFRTFILDDLKAHGLCHIQVNYFGSRGLGTVPVCDDSAVHVECLSMDRLGVNVTWRAQLENIPVPSLPGLHDIEKAIVGENLVGRFLSVIRTGNYTLNLDSKLFVADKAAVFPRDEDFSVSPQVYLGCKDGFQKMSDSEKGIRNLGGCVICPPGTSAQEGSCRPCPKGSYQENAGSTACVKCPLGTTTVYSGAYKKSQCESSCQMNTAGLLCDDEGQYLPAQKGATMNTYYCVDVYGEKLKWTEVDLELTNDQCLELRRFELVSEDKIILLRDEDSTKIKSVQIDGQKEKYLDCIMDCAMEESCDYLSVSTNGSQVVCEQYNRSESNVICTTTKQMQGVLGNPAAVSAEGLACQFKIKPTSTNSLTVYRKKGHEFPEMGLGMYEKTEFGNTVSGVYKTTVFSAEDASLSDALYYCRQSCGQDPCCNGFILSQIILNRGTILCGLLSSPDVLLCHVSDWSETSTLGGDGVCKGVRSNKEQKTFSFYLGGQEFTGSYSLLSKSLGKVEYSTELTSEVKEEIQRVFITFQKVFLLRDPDKKMLASDSGCSPIAGLARISPNVSDIVLDLFVAVERGAVTVNEGVSVAKQQYRISKQLYSSKEAALLWCLTRCKEEESWCRLADLQDSTKEYFTCIIYPDTWKCTNTTDLVPDRCDIALYSNPQLLHRRREVLGDKVQHFYTNLPYRKLTEISVRNKINMTGKSVSDGFLECELQCDADPCCRGFGYLQQSRLTGADLLCLTLGSLGIQSCSGTDSSSWHATDCSSASEGMESHPFGWFQKPGGRQSFISALCPAEDVSIKQKEGLLEEWQLLDPSSVSIDPSLSDYDSVQISGDSPKTLEIAQNYCLSVCSRSQSCVTATIEVQQTKIRCLFYPESQSCYHNLNKHQCSVLVKEPAAYIFRRKVSTQPLTSVTISSGGSLFGKSQAIQIGSDVKYVNQFLGIPYAAPPVGDNRFRPPQPYNWTGTWNATTTRSSCLQPGDGQAQYGSVSEDCLYLNVFVPYNAGTGKATLLYFHNSPSDYSENGQTFVDGSYMASLGDIIVVTASYRVGVFGFLSTGNTVPSGNWGLFDQTAALKWVQENIGHFGGDRGLVSIAADRAGADIASIHLLLADNTAFRRALLMGGSAFSPMLVISERRAQDQVQFLANEVGCLASNDQDVVSCLRKMDSNTLNAAQTKLLAQRGPFQTWGPVVDGFYIRDKQSTLIQKEIPRNIDLFIGSAEQDGLIVRAKAIKRYEESQGRGDSKMAFYQALQNSLGGEERNPRVQDAAVWFYSMQHSTDDYSGFSRALENSTRDHFIACPAIKMADYWSDKSKGRVFMYYVPESFSQSSSGLDLPEDVIYAFGLPFHSNYRNQFSIEEQNLSLKIMRYVANFIKTGNPNFQYSFSRKLMRDLPVWPQYLGRNNGDNYKEFSISLSNSQELKKAECSFWNDYIPMLKSSTGPQSEILPTKNSPGGIFKTVTSPAGAKPEKEAYN